jgi:hypothetical protein
MGKYRTENIIELISMKESIFIVPIKISED